LAERKHAHITDHSLDILHSLMARIESNLRELERLLIRLQGLPSALKKPIVIAAN
jgi:chromosomal replication initiation ATPase DnaA